MQPTYGEISIEKDSIVVYTPPNDYNGKDDIEFTLEVTNEDETLSEEVVTVDITVEPVDDVVEDIVELSSEEPVVIEPLKNDTFKEESQVVITEVSQPTNGTVVINDDNTVTYTPNTNNNSETSAEEVVAQQTTPTEDAFTYTTSVTNPDNTVSKETGSVTVTVTDKSEPGTEVNGELKAFPTAHGFGRYATGGRGGKVIPVTNLNDSGDGSLRAALTASGARTIIFRVSGTINLSTYITVKNPNFTIAGETAPGQGIQIDGSGGMQIQASNFIIRHIRFRGSSVISNLRIITSSGVVEDGIIDHCSFSWPDPAEMNISIEASSGNGNVQARDITVQNCIMGEATRGMLLYKGHYRISVYRNYFANVQQRAINANRPMWIPSNELSFEEINCLAHNTQIEMIQASYGTKFTAIGNKRTNASGSYTSSAKTIVDVYTLPGEDGDWNETYIYENDNINQLGSTYDGSTASYIKGSPYATSDITGNLILSASDIDEMLPTLGAFYWDRDAVDTRYINDYMNNTGSIGTYSGTPPTLKGGTAYTDSDGDGMSDDWETSRGLNPNSADNNGDDDNDGYTNLEEFLHTLARDY
tara:strand:+ start:33 stop:1793 length:1761 start_codon:yes stop_codon:yes gene_type:complete